MRIFRTEAWSYAVLLILLFAIAALAVSHTIAYIAEHVTSEDVVHVATILIWITTLGFMFIAGAFGLWAIQLSAAAEGRRSIGRFVDAMDYLSDGIIAVDYNGKIRGLNPAAQQISESNVESGQYIQNIFENISDSDFRLLLSPNEPSEIETNIVRQNNDKRLIRLRSQPSEGVSLIMISDITSTDATRVRNRQLARLQLIGQIARGVAHDFSNVLCGIVGHASLLERVQPQTPEIQQSAKAISVSAEKGISLAGHLLELAELNASGHFTDMIAHHIKNAVDNLKNILPDVWTIHSDIDTQLPGIPLSGLRFEQIISNLGILATDAAKNSDTLNIIASAPHSGHIFNVSEKYGCVVVITTSSLTTPILSDSSEKPHFREGGVIQSVIRSMLDEAGAVLNSFITDDGSLVFRISIPKGFAVAPKEKDEILPPELAAYIEQWNILFADAGNDKNSLLARMKELNLNIVHVNNIMSALSAIEETNQLDAMILDISLLGKESKGILRAILKIKPSAGIVVLCEDADADRKELSSDIIFEAINADPDSILKAMINSKTLATNRLNS